MMFKIIKGGRVFTPKDKGIKDILICGNFIVNIADNISPCSNYGELEVINVEGKYVVPGFIDQHVHLIGGGGEAGFASRDPEITLSQIVRNGVTTVVGCLGTDGMTRHLTSLLAKARGLEREGITAYMYTGSYEVPVQTITDSVKKDIILIEKVLGAGEIAISDHRSAQPNKEDVLKIAAETRVGGLLSGKAGVLHLHVGDGQRKLEVLFDIVHESEIPITQFIPTHINRNPYLLKDGIRFAKMGGTIDITSGINPKAGAPNSIKPSKAIKECIEGGVDIDRITMSSDSNGSMALFDEFGNIKGIMAAKMDTLYEEFRDLVKEEKLALSDALKPLTINPAKCLKLYPKKGAIRIGSDADIVVLDKSMDIEHVFAMGRTMIKNKDIITKGLYE
mgnify:CR=1 FL=1